MILNYICDILFLKKSHNYGFRRWVFLLRGTIIHPVALSSYEECAQQIASGHQLLQGPRNQPVGVLC